MRKWWPAPLIGLAAAILGLSLVWPPAGGGRQPAEGLAGKEATDAAPMSSDDSSPGDSRSTASREAAGKRVDQLWAALALRDAATRRRSLNVDPGAAILFERAERRMQDGDWDEAIVQFREVINRHPTADWVPAAFASIADVHLLKGNLKSLREARDQLDSYLEFYADSPGAEDVALKRNLLNLLLDKEGEIRPDGRSNLLRFLETSPDEDATQLAAYLLLLTEALTDR